MTKHLTRKIVVAVLATAVLAWAGPPLICQAIEIGSAKSLPWKGGTDWMGTDRAYDVSHLTEDTLALLSPGTPVPVRMETLRRAAIYAAREVRLADEITARLTARTLSGEAVGKPDPMAWFDAGYFVETVRQATLIYKYNMLSAREKQEWQIRTEAGHIDGEAWVRKAVALGGRGLEPALSKIEMGHPKANLPVTAAR